MPCEGMSSVYGSHQGKRAWHGVLLLACHFGYVWLHQVINCAEDMAVGSS